VHHPIIRLPQPGKVIVSIDPTYFRPTEVETLLGDPAKAREKLGWTPQVSFTELIKEMVAHDLNEATREYICKRSGFPLQTSCEAHM
jgi:GDPmannose 4,6-dehydratase